MRKAFVCLILFIFTETTFSQSVGIGTATPSASSVLDMGPSGKPVILPRLTTVQMNAVTSPVEGMMLYNTTEKQLYGYMRSSTLTFNNIDFPLYKWLPVTTGPRMLAWGVVDSFATEISGSTIHAITWDATNNWYKLSLSNPHEYYKDSMLLIITAVGNGSWDQAVSTGELIEGQSRFATIKFTDVSRIAAGFSTLNSRRRSGFHFILYDLRKQPY